MTFSEFFTFMWWYDLYKTFAISKGMNTGLMNREEFRKLVSDDQFNLTMWKFIDNINLNVPQDTTDAAATAAGVIYPPK